MWWTHQHCFWYSGVSTFVNLNHKLLPGTKVQSGFWFAKGWGSKKKKPKKQKNQQQQQPRKCLLEWDTSPVNCFQVQAHWWQDPGHKTAISVVINMSLARV